MKYIGWVTPITEAGGGGGGLGCIGGLVLVGIVVYGIVIGEIRLPFSGGSQPTQQNPSTPQTVSKPRADKTNTSVSKAADTKPVVGQHYDIAAIRADVTAIKFFNNGGNLSGKAYQSRFPKSEAMYINWDLNLKHPAPGTRTCFNIEAVYYGPDNKVFGTQTKDTCLESHSTSSSHTTGKGWADPGRWQVGTYRVGLSVEHNLIATGSFEIYEDPRAIRSVMPVEQAAPNPQPRRNEGDRTQREEPRERRDALIRGAQKAFEELRRRKRN